MSWQTIYEEWRNFPNLDESLKEELAGMEAKALEDAFSAPLSFGTAGMRGILGPGINRMNIYTVRQATEGLANMIDDAGLEAQKRGVVIAYDSRHLSSEFAMEAALVLAAHGIQAYVYESLRPTPVLSFAVRQLNTYAGIMITASHNPAEYNGYKVYGQDGGQMPPEEADKLTEYVRAVQQPLEVSIADKTEMLGSGLVEIVGGKLDQAYLKEMKAITMNSDMIERMSDKVSIVFTPLHGTGYYMGMKALDQAGFKNIHLVEEQAKADGDFPTIIAPNPESKEAFSLGQALAKEVEADIILATDPDADRLGAMVRSGSGNYELLTGNQLACLMLDYLLKALREADKLPGKAVAIKSIVSTDLAGQIAKSHQVDMLEVLTGFKFIAEKIKEFEVDNRNQFIFGFEESYGYLIKPFARDKDAIQALVLLSELTAYHKEKGQSLLDVLDSLYQEFGYYLEETLSFTYPGLAGKEKIQSIMTRMRENLPQSLVGQKVMESMDFLVGQTTKADGQIHLLTLPKANVLKLRLEDQSWLALRPSGTEPKIKLYLAVRGQNKPDAQAKLQALAREVKEYLNL